MFTINGNDESSVVTVQKGEPVRFEAQEAPLNTEELVELEWDLDGSGQYATRYAGEPLTEGGHVDAQMTMIAKLTISGGAITRVAVVPCWLDLRLEPELIPEGDPRFAGFLAYLRRVNDIPSTPRNPWEILYLPPADASWALRDTHFTADHGEIVATYGKTVDSRGPAPMITVSPIPVTSR